MQLTISPLILAIGFVVAALVIMLVAPRLATMLVVLCFLTGIGIALLSFIGVL